VQTGAEKRVFLPIFTDTYSMTTRITNRHFVHTGQNRIKALCFFSLLCAFLTVPAAILSAQTGSAVDFLTVTAADIRLELAEGGGWHLYIRQKKGVASVLLTETTKDPKGKAASYAYRTAVYNRINGDEKRILNGKFLKAENKYYSIVDSTAQSDEQLGMAFHLYIPEKLLYGYPWTRNGTVTVTTGTFVNIRAFQKPYADYSGFYEDNPFMFDFIPIAEKPAAASVDGAAEPVKESAQPVKTDEKKEVLLTDSYSPAAAQAFTDISNGMMIYSQGPQTLVQDVMQSFGKLPKDKSADVVFAIDATGSMWDDIEYLQKELVPALAEELSTRMPVRLGLLFYRDYTDNFKYRGLPVQFNDFTADSTVFFERLNTMHIPQGSLIGGDTPEAVYEALYASLEFYNWKNDAVRKIILIGDAEPHPSPRGAKGISKSLVEKKARKKNITIDCIITPAGR